jgi:hypothetical protein
MSRLTRRARYALWRAGGRLGRQVDVDLPHRLTVLITCFHPRRAAHVDPQVRNVLRCRFVEQVVVSSHNPDVHAGSVVAVRDPRLVLLDSPVKRGCGHRWTVAGALDPEYLLVIDDDMLLRPAQIAGLHRQLVARPEVPHGLSGFRYLEDAVLEFVDRRSTSVSFLCEAYAVTRRHLARHAALRAQLTEPLGELVDSAFDFMLISRAGSGDPRIHDLGHILRCETFAARGVAVHKEARFEANALDVARAVCRHAAG